MYWVLDERTRLAGCQMVREQVYRVIREEGIDTYKSFVREVIEEGRRSFKERVKELTFPASTSRHGSPTCRGKDDHTVEPKCRRDTLMHAPLEATIEADGTFSSRSRAPTSGAITRSTARPRRCRERCGSS